MRCFLSTKDLYKDSRSSCGPDRAVSHARNPLKVRSEFYLLQARFRQQSSHCRFLSVANLQRQKPTGDERSSRVRNQAPIDVQSAPGKQRQPRLVVTHFHGQRSAVALCNVRRIRDDNLELLARNRRKQIALDKTNAIRDPVSLRIAARNRQRQPPKDQRP